MPSLPSPSLPRLFRRLLAGAGAAALLSAAAGAQSRVVAYVPNWVELKSFSATIDYAKLTHINIAFENPVNDRGDLSFHPKNEALVARARAHRVKVLVSLAGGGVGSDPGLKQRWFELIGPIRRAGLVAKLADYVTRHQLDGLDVDLEGPAINADYGPFIRELSAALKPRGKLLTAALSQGYGGARVPDDVLPLFDFINVMAYDGAGHWAPERPGQHASMELARSSVKYWLQRGVPRDRVVLGVPFYGYGFGEAFRKRGYSYAGIVAAYPGAENADQAGSTIWYNGLPTVRAKSQYVVDEGLGGIMIWSLEHDVRDERSLLAAIYATLTANWVTRSLPRQP